jgi:hypothetical protein
MNWTSKQQKHCRSLKFLQVVYYQSQEQTHREYSGKPLRIINEYQSRTIRVTLSNGAKIDLWLDTTRNNQLNISAIAEYDFTEQYEQNCNVAVEFAYKHFNIKED